MTPGEWIKEHFANEGLNISSAARKAKISRSYLADMVGDRREIGCNLALRLEQKLGIDAGYLLELRLNQMRKAAKNSRRKK